MTNSERIPLLPIKKKKPVNRTPVIQTSDHELDDDEKRSLYKFFEDNPEEILGGRERKKGHAKRRCRCK